ncbi:hypothetical protein LZQ00_03910 [Sphingobacterium sp. SRCM116780]|uniref:hypothetical protein n=1 Tax=Sphingobacterium sp. SRCM116780 TaxID=2907623 RepID=UPI001F23E408|nr:hypothetical protein [Sphingobacterium sp. SRCM116780]UIR56966.1 hypothetical protein LZQ00_03910 [Sphingobacterium sp. SRCM116780]
MRMNILVKTMFAALGISMSTACETTTVNISQNIDNDLIIQTTQPSALPFAGIGAQWGGYDNLWQWIGTGTLSNQDWTKLFQRIDFMRPGLVRIITSQGWNYYDNGIYDPDKSAGTLFKMLDYCQSHNVSVIFGEWGEEELANNQVDEAWLDRATNFLGYLINTKGYTCIKYYNMCNEPAGSWSTIGGDYDLWRRTFQKLITLMDQKNLSSKVKLIGPDVAVWNNNDLLWWLTYAHNELGTGLKAFDIHTYPSQDHINGTSYLSTLQAYRAEVPQNVEMLMGELGSKYDYDANHPLNVENKSRIASDPNTADDSNMFVYDSFYGIDVANALIQNLQAGYNGVVVWNMDDAMYDDGQGKLKRWGFWNILGAEKFNSPQDENIRPWFYPISLFSRYVPKGSLIFDMQIPDKKGLRAIATQANNKTTIVICNSNAVTYNLNLKSTTTMQLSNAKIYKYTALDGANFTGTVDQNGFAQPQQTTTINLTNGASYSLEIPGNTFVLITTMD